MKLAAFALTVLFGLSAQAMMHPVGTFVPAQCGNQTGFVGTVRAVCVGIVVGEEGRKVQFKLADDSVVLYQVADQQNMMVALRSGAKKSMLFLVGPNGEKASMKVIFNAEGEITSAQGQVGDVGFFVPKFEMMFAIQ
ncbi:MAG: hypothetical protein AAB250_15190 [Bdellovibrionota bacterium]